MTGDTLITVVAIFLAAIIMFIFPLMTITDSNDDIAQTAVQVSTVEAVNRVTSKGVLDLQTYDALVQEISATGNLYDIEIEIQRKDENPGKKTAQVQQDKIGETTYYTVYTTQILEELRNAPNLMNLKEGDIITIRIKNTNTTIGQMFKATILSITGDNTYTIYAEHTGIVTTNGAAS